MSEHRQYGAVRAILAGLILLSLGVGSCVAKGNPEEPVELRLWNIPSKGWPDPVNVAHRRVFDAFCKAHPEIRVKALVPLKVAGLAQESNEFMAVAGGVAPDVFRMFGKNVGAYRTQRFLYPLDSYLTDYARATGKPFSGIAAPDKIWQLGIDRGNVVAIPFTYYALALKCDSAAFARVGLAGRFPRDWDELYTFARHMTVDPSKEPGAKPNEPPQYGLGLRTGYQAGWHYIQYVFSAGGDVVLPYYPKGSKLLQVPEPPVDYRRFHIRISNDADYYNSVKTIRTKLVSEGLPTVYSVDDLQWRLVTNSPKAMRAFYYYRKLVHQPWIRNKGHEFDITPDMYKKGKAVDPVTGEVFNLNDEKVQKRIYYGVTGAVDEQSGKQISNSVTAMDISPVETANTEDRTQFTFVPVPSFKGEPPAAFVSAYYLGINAAIVPEDSPGRRNVGAIREAAWKYIEFMTGPQAQEITIKTLVEFGQAEYVRPSLLMAAGYQDIAARVPQSSRLLWGNLENYARVEPYCPGFTNVQTKEFGMALEELVNDTPDPHTGEYRRDPQEINDKLCHNVNTLILGKMPESEVKRRSGIGWIIFGVMMLGIALGATKIVRLAMASQAKWGDNEGFGVGGHPARRRLYAWIFLIPAIGTIAIWAYYPLIRGMMMAFQDYRILGGSRYVGLRNFIEAASDAKFWLYLLHSIEYMVLSVGIGFFIPIALAILLTEIPRAKVLYRVLYYLPAVTTGLVTLFLWKGLMFDPTDNGILNRFMLWFNTWPLPLVVGFKLLVFGAVATFVAGLWMQAVHPVNGRRLRIFCGVVACGVAGASVVYFANLVFSGGFSGVISAFGSPFSFKAQSFFRDPKLAMLWVVVPTIWAGAGPGCLIYLAALKGIPEEQYEAADLDGAGIWHKIVNVTYPNLAALMIINLVGAVIGGLKESGNIFVMTGGGPEDATMTVGLHIWYNAFMYLNFGLATSMAWIVAALLIGFTLKQLQILNKLQFRNTAIESETGGGRS